MLKNKNIFHLLKHQFLVIEQKTLDLEANDVALRYKSLFFAPTLIRNFK